MPLAARHGFKAHRPPPRVREGEDRDYRKMVSRLPCIICGKEEPRVVVDPHHLQRSVPVGQRGTGLRAVDKYAIPLCRKDHRWAEATGDDEARLASKGVQGRDVAAELWRRRESFAEMRAYVVRSLFNRGTFIR